MKQLHGRTIFELFNSHAGDRRAGCQRLADEVNSGLVILKSEAAPSDEESRRCRVNVRGAESLDHQMLKRRAKKWLRMRGESCIGTEVSGAAGISDVASSLTLVECGDSDPLKSFSAFQAGKVFAILPYWKDRIFVFRNVGDPRRFDVFDDILTIEDF